MLSNHVRNAVDISFTYQKKKNSSVVLNAPPGPFPKKEGKGKIRNPIKNTNGKSCGISVELKAG
jgi:hypothetical protein